MPYRNTRELPDWVREMPKHAQEIYLAAFNSALEQYNDEGKAAQVAIAAVKEKYKKSGDRWVLKEEFMENLIEYFENPLSEAVVEPELNIIRNVCLLAPISKNNLTYSQEAMRGALSLFEGAKAFANHPKKSELGGIGDVRDLIGKYQSIRLDNGKVKGDLKVLKPHAGWLFPLAEQMPEAVGLSLRGNGKIRIDKNGQKLVEQIAAVYSVDLVTEPATTTSLFEQFNQSEEETMSLEKITLKEFLEARPDLVEAIEEKVRKESKDMGEKEKLQAQVKKLEEQVKEKDLELDEFRVKEKLAEKRKLIEKLLKESKLQREAPEAITPEFRKLLETVEEQKDGEKTITVEEKVKTLIKDRETVAFKESGKVRGMGGEKDDGEKQELTNIQLKEAVKRGRQLSASQVI